MKRISFLAITLCFIFVCACNKNEESSSSKNDNSTSLSPSNISQVDMPEKTPILWGDSIATVKNKELSSPLDETESALSYESIVFDQPCTIIYRFDENDGLYSVYVSAPISIDDSDAIFDFYDRAVNAVKEKYGPAEEKVISKNIGETILGNGHSEFLNGEAFLDSSWESKEISAKVFAGPDNEKAYISIDVEKKPEFLAEEISVGGTYTIPDLCEFTINYVELKKEVTPPHPSGYYTYYPEEDGKTYIDLSVSIKNTRTTRRGADEFGIVTAICGDGYEYNAFSIIEEKNGSDFTYTNITNVDPLETANIHYLTSIPNELADDETVSIYLEITILDQNYTLSIR